VRAGKLERLRAVLAAEPALISATRDGRTPLFFLAPPEEHALEIAELLLAHGADAAFKDADDLTAADVAAKAGFDELAEQLRVAQRG
jgi:ankyrin repeat protein